MESRLSILEVFERVYGDGDKRKRCIAMCTCRRIKEYDYYKVRSGHTRSCGCLGAEVRTRHGKHNAPEYSVWEGMKARCFNANNVKFKLYGGRGITVCEKWLTFSGFYEDMGERPDGMTLERIDGNKGYSKENCKWATPKEQASNTTQNHFLVYRGERRTITQWAEHLGWIPAVIFTRIRLGWSVEEVLGTPKGNRSPNKRSMKHSS